MRVLGWKQLCKQVNDSVIFCPGEWLEVDRPETGGGGGGGGGLSLYLMAINKMILDAYK